MLDFSPSTSKSRLVAYSVIIVAVVGILTTLSVTIGENIRDSGLLKAARTGNVQKIARALDRNEAVVTEVIDKHGRTLLQVAAEAGQLAMVQLLIDHVDPNFRDKDGHTALWSALTNNRDEVVDFLLENGAVYEAPETSHYDGAWVGTTSQGLPIRIRIRNHGSEVGIDADCMLQRSINDPPAKKRTWYYSVKCVIWDRKIIACYSGQFQMKPDKTRGGTADPVATGESGCRLTGAFSSRSEASGTFTSTHEGFQPITVKWTATNGGG